MNQVTYLKQREGETIPELAKRIAEAHQAMRNPQPEIISRAEAKERGLKHYFTGKPCHRGGVAKRIVSSFACQCVKCLDAQSEKFRNYREKNSDQLNKRIREWRSSNRERLNAYDRDYRNKNHELMRSIKRREYAKNADGYKARARKRFLEKEKRIPSWFGEFDEFVISEALELTKLRERDTGIKWHADHMVPLQASKASGLHCANNIQVIPSAMNLAKKNKMILTEPLEWLR